jgi:RNA polymerase sigma-54 factor
MTPELRQAIAILQMSTLELGEYLQKELEENPVLEQKENEEPVEIEKETENKTEDWLEIFNDRDIGLQPRDMEEKTFDNFVIKRPSLYEHLQFQLQLSCKDKMELAIGNYLIGSIDSNGYLVVELQEVAEKTGSNVEQVERVLQLIQSFHPHGVGARDLVECLLIQVRYYGKDDPATIMIIKEHLEDLARGRLNKIAQAQNLSVFQVQQICDFIRTLDPKPGLQYSSDEVKYIVPDVVVEKIDGKYIVMVNDISFPRLVVNQLYENMLRNPEGFTFEARKYMEDKINSAIWLIKSIEQRRMTLYKVASCIVDIQTEFLDKGIQYLKPLNLKHVAELVDVHESTVSRATSNKYIQTPQGLFELKYFFGSGVESYSGDHKVSSKSIKSMIQDIIDKEDTANPLSDNDIVNMLKRKGIRISRRTVAKYRQEMGIQSTVSRKRYDQ